MAKKKKLSKKDKKDFGAMTASEDALAKKIAGITGRGGRSKKKKGLPTRKYPGKRK